MGKDKQDKKRKRPAEAESTIGEGKTAEASTSFSLFGGSAKNGDLDDIFGKSASFVRPETLVPPPAPLPKLDPPALAEASSTSNKSKKAKKSKATVVNANDDNDDLAGKASKATTSDSTASGSKKAVEKKSLQSKTVAPPMNDSDSDSDSSMDLVHESLKVDYKPSKKKDKKKAAFIPPNETSEDRDRRTIFVGNLPIECAKSKLRAHILSFAPSAKIESVRFRSVAFATPTASLPTEGDEDSGKRAKREKERAAAWRDHQTSVGKKGKDEDEVDKSKTFLDAKGKRKVAFIKKDFHSELESCNAYIVFEHPHPDRAANVAPIMDPSQAASLALQANATTFMDRTIRVDSLHAAAGGSASGSAKRDGWLPQGANPRLSLFVGGLDYAAKEEDVRVFFEELLKAERGKAPDGGKWISGVRIIRDKETQLGKGFGYIHVSDRESIDELLAIEPSKLKFAKKQLRLQRSKALPPQAKATPSATPAASSKTDAGAKSKSKVAQIPAVKKKDAPKGNPLLGERLKDLSKEDRKLAKMADADRQARRLSKKKLSMKLKKETGAVKLTATKGERERSKSKVKAKKGRGRSAAQISKMKGTRA